MRESAPLKSATVASFSVLIPLYSGVDAAAAAAAVAQQQQQQQTDRRGQTDRWPAGSRLLVVGSADGNQTITAIS